MTLLSHNRSSFFDLRLKDKLLVGDQPYIVEKAVSGGMGFVLLLRQDHSSPYHRFSVHGGSIALKTVRPDVADQASLQLFRRELTVWAGFVHPNIVRLNEILDGGKDGWIAAMDWCRESLRDILSEKSSLPLLEASKVIANMLDGLAYAYQQDKVLHLDLKPENILYNGERFVVSDWGIASIKQPHLNAIAGLPPTSKDALLTFNNIGTVFYMAPERFCKGFHSSVASDIFSLGMIYLELLTGKLPHHVGIHPVESLLSGQYLGFADELLTRRNIPRSIRHLILSMMAFDPKDRSPSYPDLRTSLIRAYRSQSGFFSKLLN